MAAQVETTKTPSPALTSDEIVARLTRADTQRHDGLEQYSVVRKYILSTERADKTSEMVVRMEFRRGQGKTFEILSSTGADGIRGHVLRRLLEAEVDASKDEALDKSKVTHQNYSFRLLGTETKDSRLCYVLELTPRTKSKYLLHGTAWIDAQEWAIVRMEGRPSASVSFWVGKPLVTMEFDKVGDFWLISHNYSHVESRFVSATDLRIDSSDYQVQAVGQRASIRRDSSSPSQPF